MVSAIRHILLGNFGLISVGLVSVGTQKSHVGELLIGCLGRRIRLAHTYNAIRQDALIGQVGWLHNDDCFVTSIAD